MAISTIYPYLVLPLRQTFPDKVRVEPGLLFPSCAAVTLGRRVQSRSVVRGTTSTYFHFVPRQARSRQVSAINSKWKASNSKAGEEATKDSLLPGLSWTGTRTGLKRWVMESSFPINLLFRPRHLAITDNLAPFSSREKFLPHCFILDPSQKERLLSLLPLLAMFRFVLHQSWKGKRFGVSLLQPFLVSWFLGQLLSTHCALSFHRHWVLPLLLCSS